MGIEILQALEGFQREATKGVQETLEGMPVFNVGLKNDLMTRLIDVFQYYKIGISNRKVEDFIDEEIFPLINKAGLKNLESKSGDYLQAVNEFVEGLNPQQEQEQEPATEQEKINKSMGKFYGFSDEIKKQNTDFSDLFSEVKNLLIRNLSLDPDNFELLGEVTRIVSRTQESAEEYHSERYNGLIGSGKKNVDEVYMIYNQLLANRSIVQTEEVLPENKTTPFQ